MSMSEQVVRSSGCASRLRDRPPSRPTVDHVMAVAGAFRKGRAIAGAQHRLAAILDQRQLAFEHVDELVLVRMPVALARPVARRQAHEIDAEIGKPAGVAQPLPHALGAGRVEGRRIARAFAFRHGGDVDLGHGRFQHLIEFWRSRLWRCGGASGRCRRPIQGTSSGLWIAAARDRVWGYVRPCVGSKPKCFPECRCVCRVASARASKHGSSEQGSSQSAPDTLSAERRADVKRRIARMPWE